MFGFLLCGEFPPWRSTSRNCVRFAFSASETLSGQKFPELVFVGTCLLWGRFVSWFFGMVIPIASFPTTLFPLVFFQVLKNTSRYSGEPPTLELWRRGAIRFLITDEERDSRISGACVVGLSLSPSWIDRRCHTLFAKTFLFFSMCFQGFCLWSPAGWSSSFLQNSRRQHATVPQPSGLFFAAIFNSVPAIFSPRWGVDNLGALFALQRYWDLDIYFCTLHANV